MPKRRRPPAGDAARNEEFREGLVVRLQGRSVLVEVGETLARCSLRKSLFREHGAFTGPVAVGDRVEVLLDGPHSGVVEGVLLRKGYLSRRHGESGLEQVIVANAHQVAITVSLRDPEFRPRIIDRILVATERGGMEGWILLTKADLVTDRTPYLDYARLYERLGYRTLFVSSRTGEGIDSLREGLAGRITVFTGQSGVGKSTLLNLIQPNLALPTQEVSEKWGKGRHTTSAVHLMRVDCGGYVVDTPGIRSFSIAGLEASDIAIFFRDFTPWIERCRLPNCRHDHEPACAVKAAVEAGEIDERRYESYLRILQGMEEDED